MDDLIKLVRTYRLTAGISEKLRLAERIIRLIGPDLQLFVFGAISHHAAEDALQEVLKAIAINMHRFAGSTEKEFWGWCYRIARNKLNDQFRKQYADRIQLVPPEDIWRMIDASAQDQPISAGERLDLEYAMQLLTASKPECGDFLWKHFMLGRDYGDIADACGMSYDSVRMKIGRCLEEAQTLVS
jgi:DNA-directed RNA polymerase specialized sigma24 family protein